MSTAGSGGGGQKSDRVDRVIDRIAGSAKYRVLHVDTIRRVVERKALGAPNGRETEKRARRELHQILADYHSTHSHKTARALVDRICAALAARQPEIEIRAGCAELLDQHATTRERLPMLDRGYYDAMFEVTGRPSSVIDLASALHPFELRWMGLGDECTYVAYDNNERFATLADRYLGAEGVGTAVWSDVLVGEPSMRAVEKPAPVDIAFFLMTYHCIDGQHAGSGWQVIERSPATWTAVSLPVSGFGSRSGDSFQRLAAELDSRLDESGRHYRVVEWETERLYLIRNR